MARLPAYSGLPWTKQLRVSPGTAGRSIRRLSPGDLMTGQVRIWTLADSQSKPLPMPVAATPAAVGLVAPVLAPAEPFSRNPVASRSTVDQSPPLSSRAADLEAALASALESAASAGRTVTTLISLARAHPPGSNRSSATNALKSANVAVIALEAALASDPGNSSLERALAETKLAVKTLERERNGTKATAASSSQGR